MTLSTVPGAAGVVFGICMVTTVRGGAWTGYRLSRPVSVVMWRMIRGTSRIGRSIDSTKPQHFDRLPSVDARAATTSYFFSFDVGPLRVSRTQARTSFASTLSASKSRSPELESPEELTIALHWQWGAFCMPKFVSACLGPLLPSLSTAGWRSS